MDTALKKNRVLYAALPVLFYTPETRFGFGATGVCIFNWKRDSTDAARSGVSLSAIYTQNRQVLFTLPFNLYIRNRSWQSYGELTFNRFLYNFYGVGNDMPRTYSEKYGIEFPRLRFTILKKLDRHFFAGLRYAYDNYSLYRIDTSGVLYRNKISGSAGGVVSGFGLVCLFDSRDNVFFPSRGLWSELVLYHDDPRTGSSFSYSRVAFDFVKYLSLRKNILALNFYTIYSNTDLPFFQMAQLGGAKKMRGYYEGRYRDNNAVVLQAEYRRMVFGPFGLALFASAGQVAKRYEAFNAVNWRFTWGGGLRLMVDDRQKITIRLDAAVGNGQILPYFTVGEAF